MESREHEGHRVWLAGSKSIYYFIWYCVVSTRAQAAFCTSAHMHAWLTWDPREDLIHSKYICKQLLWVLQFGYTSYYMGFRVPWVYMSQYWHFGHNFHFSCAPRAELLKMAFLCFGPGLMVTKGLKALGCLHAKA